MYSISISSLRRILYEPLDASRNEIRVLSFEPPLSPKPLAGFRYRGPLRLTLEHVSLHDWKPEYLRFRTELPNPLSTDQVIEAWCEQFKFEPEQGPSDIFRTLARFTWGDYKAISYVWGNIEERETIIVNGVPVAVGKNLAAALAHHQSTHGHKIWVDAICINQGDFEERNLHVMRIRDIFSLSSMVAIWLGEDETSHTGLDSWVEDLFDTIRRCDTILKAHGRQTLEAALGVDIKMWRESSQGKDFEGFSSRDVLYFDDENWVDSDDDSDFGPLHFRDLVTLALLRIAQNPYWTRLWIIQELVVSPISSTLQWGNAYVPLQTILILADIFCNKIIDSGSLNSIMVKIISPCLYLLKSVLQWRGLQVLSNKEDGLKDTALNDLLRLAESAKCTMPQDKVYGLLGLLPQSTCSKITIDYRRDGAELISEFTAVVSHPDSSETEA